MTKRIVAVLTVLALTLGIFTACSKLTGNDKDGPGGTVKEIRYLNFKPEIAQVYDDIAAAYEEETGIKLIVETAASGTYESTLTARMATDEAPTIFQINGPIGYVSWSDYCADLKDTELYKHLKDKSLAIKSGDSVYGIPYVVEGYGIIYNKSIMDKYFDLSDRATTVTAVDQINNFETLKAVVEDMQARREDLGISGVFASTSLKTGEDWRWQTHLMNIPLSLEFEDKNIDLTGDDYQTIELLK